MWDPDNFWNMLKTEEGSHKNAHFGKDTGTLSINILLKHLHKVPHDYYSSEWL